MNSNKNMKIYLIFTLVVMFFCCPQIYAYYSKNDSKSVTIGTKDLIITGSTSATTYAADSNGVVSIPVTIKNDSGFAVNYNLTLSNTNLKFNDGSTVYRGTIAANTTSTVTLKIVEVNPLGTENTDIDMAVTGPYTKTIDIGSYVLTYDLTPPSCSFSTSSTVLTGNTTTVSVTCTDASGVKTTSLATSAISLKSSLGTLSNPTVTSVTNGYKYSFTYTAGSKAGTETFTLIAGKVSDNVNNTNAATTGTITVQRQVKGTFNINGASSFTYNGTKYTSTTTLTLCTLSSETTCSVTMPTITASTNTPTVIGWSTASGTHTATYTSGQTVSISNNVTLYAQTTKTEITRKVTFGCNGGSGTVASTSCTISATYNGTAQGTSCAVTLPTSGCTYSGWNFQGWNTSDTATTGVTGSVSISSNKTYYAIWKKNAKTYTLSFNTNLINKAGICSASATAPATQSCQIAAVYNGATQATSCTVTIPTLFDYQTGEWDFNGWGTSSSSTSSVDSGSQVTLSSNKTLYATWAKPVTLRFNANGCATESKTVSQTLYNFNVNSTVTVPSVTMNTNWTSLGVSSSASSTSQGTAIGSSMSYSTQCSNSVHDFYYNCKKDVTVTFNANSCTSASGSVTKTLYNGATSTAVTVPTKDMINTTWKTLGASASASSTSQGTAMGSSMTISSIGSSTTSVNRYYNCYKEVGVNFYSNYCTTDAGWVNSTIYNGATSVTVSMPTDYTAESGRTIKGASTDGSSHSASSTVTVPLGNLTNSIGYAYFICTRNFDIIFKANGCATGDKTVSKTLYSKDDSFTVDVPAPTMKTGWTNLGAASSSTATSGSTSTVSVSTSGYYTSETFYYTCTKPAIKYTATYNCNGGTGNVSSTSCTIDAVYNGASQASSCSVTAPTSGCTYSGWDFQGWNASSTATSGFTGAVDITKNHTWYAIWKKPEKKYTVTFYGNGGSGSTASESCTIDAVYNGDDQATNCYIEYPENGFTYSGWTFNGWASSSSYTGGNTPGAVLAISADTPRYATWKKDVTVTFNANSCASENKTATTTIYNGATTASVTVPTPTMNTNWTTLGASTSSSATSGTTAGSSLSVSVGSTSKTGTAYFICKKDVTVTFNTNGCASESKTASKTIYNGATTASVTVPTPTMNTNWTTLGASTSSSATSGTTAGSSLSVSIGSTSKTGTAYFICKKDVTVVFNDNKCTTASKNATTTLYNGNTSASVTVPTATMNSEWTTLGASSSSSTTSSGTSMGSTMSMTVGTAVITVNRYYNCYKDVTVTFKANGCTTSDQTATMKLYNGGASNSVVVPTATMNSGWTTLGASASASSTSNGTAMGSSMTIGSIASTTTTTTRYYNCTKPAITRTAKFSCNGGTGTVVNDQCTIDAVYNGTSQATSCTVTLPTTGCSLSGFTFVGWNVSASGKTGATGDISINEDKQYYAIYKKDVTVTFKANGCTTADGSATMTLYNNATSGSVTVPTKTMNTNWTSLGASSSSSSTSSGTAMGSNMTISSVAATTTSVTRYYNCSKSVTVTFNANGCTTTSPTASMTLYNGSTSGNVTVPSATAKTSWTLLGASTSASSTSSGIDTGSSMSVSGVTSSATTATGYFNCSKDITVTFKANGCTTADGSATKTLYNGSTSTSVTVPTKSMNSGWTSLGASTSASSTSQGTAMDSSMSLTVATSVKTLTRYYNCVKAAKNLTVSYNCTQGTTAPESSSCTIPAVYNGATQDTSCTTTLADNTCTYSGWTFAGWGTYSGATSGSSAGTSVTLSVSLTKYAIWKKVVTVQFNRNNCTVSDGDRPEVTIYNGATSLTTTVTAATAIDGWTSLGVSGSSASTSQGTAVGSSITITGIGQTQDSVERYRNCKKDVTVTFKANGCTTADGSVTKTLYNGATSTSVTVPTVTMNSGWTTLGASSSSSSKTSGTSMNSSMSITGIADATTSVTRYYNCSKAVTVTFNANGCTTTSPTASMTLYNGATSGSVTVPSATEKTSWTLLGASASSSSTSSGTAIGSSMTISGVASASTTATRYFNCSKDITVTFNANGCTTAAGSATMTLYNGGTSGSVTVPTKTMNSGWSSLGASASASSTSQGTAMGSNMSITGVASATTSVTRYYNCIKAAKEYTATFDCNGGTGTPAAAQKCTIAATYNGTAQETSCKVTVPSTPGCSKSSWTWIGWGTSSASTSSSYGNGSLITLTASKTFYSVWQKAVTVTFNANGCTTAAQTATMNLYNGATSGTVTVPSATMNTNWTTLGASSSSSSTSSGTAMGSSMTISSISATQTSATRYYNCKKDVTVTFNANSCTTAAQTATTTLYNGSTSATVTVPTATMNTSWTSLGASASSSTMTSGTSMGSTMSVTIATGSKTATRYYNCRKEVTITFNANGCTTGNATATGYLYNGATTGGCTVPSATLKSGWSDLDASTSSGATTGTAPGGTLTGISVGSTSTTGTAYFICNKTVTVTFSANGCTTGNTTATATLHNGGTSTSVKVPSATMNSGWTSLGASASSSSTSSGTAMGSSMSLTVASSVTTLTRYYNCSKASKKFTATYDCNGGSGSVADKTCTIPAVYNGATQATSCELELPSSGCSMSGFDFLGWNVSPDATTGGKGGSLPASSNKQYYAIYKKNAITYTVSFNGNGGSGSTGSVSCTIPAVYNGDTQETSCSATLPSNGFTYSGWTFNGWGTGTSSTSGTAAGGSVTLTSNITRYATWKKTFTLTCSKGANVSSIGATSRSCSVYNGDNDGCTVYLPTITANTGYTSVGWGSSSGATSGTSAGSAYTLTANKTLYANATDQTAPTCGTVSNAGSSSSWAKSRTITVGCTESGGSGCSQTTFQKTFSSGTSTSGTITISDNAGNTTNCTVATYIDNTAPTCYYSGTGATAWKNYDRTFTVHCSDDNSGCVQDDYSKTFSTTTYITTGTITVYDNAGNSKTCTSFNVYIDKVKPTIKCTVNSGGTSGVSVTVTASDSNSGLATNPSGTFTITSSKTYTATDNAGNSNSCTVTVTRSVYDYYRRQYTCATASWNSATVSYTSMSGCTSSGGGAMDSSKTTCTTISNSTCTSNGQSIPCLKKQYSTRKGCATWNSTASSTTYPTSCSASTGSYYKYTCTVRNYTYSGSA